MSVSMNTTQILLYLNKTLYSKEPEKLSDNNQLLRLYTYMDSRAATELGSKIRELPNISRAQEKAEIIITKFRAAKSEGAIKAFNMFVDEIQEPSTRSAKYTQQLDDLKKAFDDFIKELSTTMTKLLPESLGDNKIRPYLEELKGHDRFKPLSSTVTGLEKEGVRLEEQFGKIEEKAEITLNAVAPDVALADKNKAAAAQRQQSSEPPSTLSNE